MATVTGYTAERMKEIEDSAIVDGAVVGNNLFLSRFDGGQIDAGNVRGPQGEPGVTGDTAILIVTSGTRPGSPFVGSFIYETDTHRLYSWNGTAWVYRGGVVLCTSVTRPTTPFTGLSIYETDTKRSYTWDGAAWAENGAKAMRCKVNRTTVQAINNNTMTSIVWVNEEYDTGGLWSPGGTADSFIIPANGAGPWRVTLCAQFGVHATGVRQLVITQNGAPRASFNGVGNSGWYVGSTISADLMCANGDAIKASAFHTAGVALNIDSSAPVTLSIFQIV